MQTGGVQLLLATEVVLLVHTPGRLYSRGRGAIAAALHACLCTQWADHSMQAAQKLCCSIWVWDCCPASNTNRQGCQLTPCGPASPHRTQSAV